jgi:hypothetical protein
MADTTTINHRQVVFEVLYYLRNSDVFSTTVRGVVTGTDTGTFTSASSYTLTHTNAKNIRSLSVASVPLKYGRDYTLADGGIISFTTAQSGAYSISYDYGNTDKIFPDLPQNLSALDDFPRIGLQWLGSNTQPGGFGSVDVSDLDVSVVVYAFGTQAMNDYLSTLRTKFRQDKSNFWFLGAFVQILSVGPVILEDKQVGRDKLMHQNIDVRGRLRYEK